MCKVCFSLLYTIYKTIIHFTEYKNYLSENLEDGASIPFLEWSIACEESGSSNEPEIHPEVHITENVEDNEVSLDQEVSINSCLTTKQQPLIEVYHFQTIQAMKEFINLNIPGIISMFANSPLSDTDRSLLSKEIIQNVLDSFPSQT